MKSALELFRSFIESPTALLGVIYLINFILSFGVIFLERKSPSATLAWLMVLNLLPGFGIFLYIFLSQNITKQKLYHGDYFEIQKSSKELRAQMDDMNSGKFTHTNPAGEKWEDLIFMNQNHALSHYTQNNHVDVFIESIEKFDKLHEDMEKAEKYINFEYFIMRPDEVGMRVLEVLTRKAREGVKVRLLLDAFGSNQIREHHLRELRAAGGQAAFFFPPTIFRINLRLNYRNHRKLVVIDGETAYIGGLNVAKEYIGKSRKFSGWRDTHLRIQGGCVMDIDERFKLDWNCATKEVLAHKKSDYMILQPPGNCGIQIASSGPENPEEEIKRVYLKMISNAKKSVFIQTPYFIPDESIFEAMKTAALSGIDVRLMIPNKPDHPFVYWVTYYNAAEMMDSGVKVYIYNAGFMHCKMITVDGEVSSVGSANFDIRSFKLNFETNAVLYDHDLAVELEESFLQDMKDSTHLTPAIYAKRSLWIRLKQGIGRLISDIL